MKHLRLNCFYGPDEHPQVYMKKLGITYQIGVAQSIADQWWFFNCENIPEPLPEHLSILDIDPFDAIGYGLSKEDTQDIKNHKLRKYPQINC